MDSETKGTSTDFVLWFAYAFVVFNEKLQIRLSALFVEDPVLSKR